MTDSHPPTQELSYPLEEVVGLTERFQPRNLTELMKWAKVVVTSGLAPKGMNEAGVVLAVQHGAELRVSPSQALSGIAVVNGRPSVFGDLGLAIFQRDADFESFEERDPVEALQKGEGWCKITMKDGREIARTFSVEEAHAAKLIERGGPESPWTKYRGRMLQWRARWLAMRDADAKVFKGLAAREEMEDIVDLGRAKVKMPTRSDGVDSEEVDKFVKETGRGAPAPVTRPAPTTPKRNDAPPAKGGETYTGTIKGLASFDTKKKNSDGSFFQRYELTMTDGTVFRTIKSEHIDAIKQIGKGSATISFAKNQYGNEIQTIEAAKEEGKQEDLGGGE